MRVEIFLVCRYAEHGPGNFPNMIGAGIGGFNFPEFPAQLGMPFYLVFRATFTEEESGKSYPLDAVIKGPDGSVLQDLGSQVIQVAKAKLAPVSAYTAILSFNGITFPTPGAYSIEVSSLDNPGLSAETKLYLSLPQQ